MWRETGHPLARCLHALPLAARSISIVHVGFLGHCVAPSIAGWPAIAALLVHVLVVAVTGVPWFCWFLVFEP